MLDQKIVLVFTGIFRRNHDPRQLEPCWLPLDIELSSSKRTGHSISCLRESMASILSSTSLPRFHPVEPKTIQQDQKRRMSQTRSVFCGTTCRIRNMMNGGSDMKGCYNSHDRRMRVSISVLS